MKTKYKNITSTTEEDETSETTTTALLCLIFLILCHFTFVSVQEEEKDGGEHRTILFSLSPLAPSETTSKEEEVRYMYRRHTTLLSLFIVHCASTLVLNKEEDTYKVGG